MGGSLPLTTHSHFLSSLLHLLRPSAPQPEAALMRLAPQRGTTLPSAARPSLGPRSQPLLVTQEHHSSKELFLFPGAAISSAFETITILSISPSSNTHAHTHTHTSLGHAPSSYSRSFSALQLNSRGESIPVVPTWHCRSTEPQMCSLTFKSLCNLGLFPQESGKPETTGLGC